MRWIPWAVWAWALMLGAAPAAEDVESPPAAADPIEAASTPDGETAEAAPAAVDEPRAEPAPETPAETDAAPSSAAAEPAAATPDPAAAVPPPVAAAPRAVRVRVDLAVRGELFAPTGPDAPPARQPIAVEGRFDFVEEAAGGGPAVVTRTYDEAQAIIRVDDRPHTVALPADARRVEVALAGTTPMPFLADAFLAREEADLLDTPFDSLLLDRLTPAGPVAVGGTWSIPADAAAGLLAIDTVESGGLEAELIAVENGVAQVRLAGIVDGAVDGVPTHLAVEGDCTLDAAPARDDAGFRLLTPRVAAITIRERRQAGHVAPGFDVEARVTVARRPGGDRVEHRPAAAATNRRRGVGRPGLVWHRGADDGYDLVHDARWRMVEDGPTGLVMRLVDRGALVGQCSLTVLPRADALAPPTIAEVQRDVERALAGQFGRFEHAAEATRSDGVRIVRVASAGSAENRDFRWIHYVLTDAAGRRAAATFMFETASAKRFASADRELVDGLAFPDDSGPASPAPEPPREREARAPRETVTP